MRNHFGSSVISLLVVALVCTLVGVFVMAASSVSAGKDDPFVRRPLTGVAEQGVGSYAVSYARAMGLVASGTPQVIVSKKITAADLPVLFAPAGLKSVFFRCGDPPLALTVQQGDFLTRTAGRAHPGGRSQHLALVFDVNEGVPAVQAFGNEAEAAANAAARIGGATVPSPVVTQIPGALTGTSPSLARPLVTKSQSCPNADAPSLS